MKPYLTKPSHRPGCSCCISKQGHGHHGNRADPQGVKAAKRSGKKAARQAARQAVLDGFGDGLTKED